VPDLYSNRQKKCPKDRKIYRLCDYTKNKKFIGFGI